MMAAPSTSPAAPAHLAPCEPPSRLQIAGAVVCRLIVPGWLLAGALWKLSAMNPKLLPPPVLGVVDWFAGVIARPAVEIYDPALRLIVMAEIALAFTMVFAPRLSRLVAGTVLGLFCVILIAVLVSGGADCGCFGAGGPPPWAMLVIDAMLLIAVLSLPLPHCRRTCTATLGVVAAALVFGAAVAWTAPGIGITLPPAGEGHAHDTRAHAGSNEPAHGTAAGGTRADASAPTTVPPTAIEPAATNTAAPPATEPAPAVRPWPGMPAKAQPYYDAEVKTWVGKRLDEQDVARLIQNPPINPNEGRLHIVFMREDCEHCHALLTKFFSQPKLDTRTLAVIVPDATGTPEENPCTDCQVASLFKGGIIWMFTTPLVLTVENGVVVGACDATDAQNDDLVRATLNAGT